MGLVGGGALGQSSDAPEVEERLVGYLQGLEKGYSLQSRAAPRDTSRATARYGPAQVNVIDIVKDNIPLDL